MSETLYRKYRPQNWASVSGQDHVVQTLLSELKLGRTSHAYIFSGPRGVGKTTVARLLAKTLNCGTRNEKTFEPCGDCGSCADISSGRSIDVMEIDAASHTGVDNVRENIISAARFETTSSKYKIFIIDEVHMLSTPAFNALLKTLEEPPARVVFILATTELLKIPATIVSRCEKFNFKRIPNAVMEERLKNLLEKEGAKAENAVIKQIIHLSEGCFRDAESILGQLISVSKGEITTETSKNILPMKDTARAAAFLSSVLQNKKTEAFEIISGARLDGLNTINFIDEILELLRDGIILKMQGDSRGLFEFAPNKESIANEFESHDVKKLVRLADTLITRRSQISFSSRPDFVLELWVAENTDEENDAAKNALPQIDAAAEQKPKKNSVELELTKNEPAENQSNIDEFKSAWHTYISGLSEENLSMRFLLSSAQIESWNRGRAVLCLSYPIHKDKIMERKNKAAIEEALEKIMNTKVTIDCAVLPKNTSAGSASGGFVQDAIEENGGLAKLNEAFGGQIID